MKQGKKVWRGEREERTSDAIPISRSYGTQKKRAWVVWGQYAGYRFFAILVLFFFLFTAANVVLAWLIAYPEMWLKLLAAFVIVVCLTIRLTRTLRKRRKFLKNLKKLCREQGYSVEWKQSFFQSLVWIADQYSFVLETENTAYYVRYLTIDHYRSTLYFENSDVLKVVKNSPRNRYLMIFDIRYKAKYYPIEVILPERTDGKRSVDVLLVNPVCVEMQRKSRDGGYEGVGDGSTLFGFTVHTGSGFLDALEREE